MKTLYESLLDDKQDLMNRYDLGASVPKIIQLLDDPLSAHYHLYSGKNFTTGFETMKDAISHVKREDFLKYKEEHHKNATDIWMEKGQPGWDALWKLADKSLKKAEVNKGDYGEYIKFTRPSQLTGFNKAKVITIDIAIYNKRTVKRNPYLIIRFEIDKTNSSIQLNIWPDNYFNTSFDKWWEQEIYDINSNPTWMGLINEIIEHFDSEIPKSKARHLLKRYKI